MRVIRICHVDIVVHPLLPLFALIMALLQQGQLLFLAFLSITLHEICHGMVARILGFRLLSIELTPFGGIALIEGNLEIRPFAELCIAAAGPASNLLMAMTAVFIQSFYAIPVEGFVRVNIIYCILNLLPFLPLDGGRIARAILTPFMGIKRATKALSYAGAALGVLSCVLGLISLKVGKINITYLVMGVYIITCALREARMAPLYAARSVMERQNFRPRKEKHLVASMHCPVSDIVARILPDWYYIVRVLGDDGRVLGALEEAEIVDMWLRDKEKPLGALLD